MENIELKNNENFEDNNKKRIRIILMRHGEKSSYHGDLTEGGKEKATEIGKNLSGATKFYHTFISRTKQTAEAIAKGIPNEQVLGYKENRDLQYKELDGTILLSKDMLDRYNKIASENNGDETEAIIDYISSGDRRLDEESLSPRESFHRMLKPILKAIEGSRRFGDKNTQDLNLIGVSHVLNLTVLLWGLLSNAEENPRDFIFRIGGPISYLEDIEFFIENKFHDQNGLSLKFRGQEYFIPSEKLKLQND